MIGFRVQHFGQREGQLERLFGIKSRVAMGVIPVAQRIVGNRHSPADTLGYILPGHLDMDAPRMGSLGAVYIEKALNLSEDAVKWACFVSAFRLDDIAMHRVAGPNYRVPFAFNSPNKLR